MVQTLMPGHNRSIDHSQIADRFYFQLWINHGSRVSLRAHLACAYWVVDGEGVVPEEELRTDNISLIQPDHDGKSTEVLILIDFIIYGSVQIYILRFILLEPKRFT